jgi:hypothetical protein
MEIYRRETQEIVGRFLSYQLSFPDCVLALHSALHSALDRLLPTLPTLKRARRIYDVRAVMLANNVIVMEEMARRSAKQKGAFPFPKIGDTIQTTNRRAFP